MNSVTNTSKEVRLSVMGDPGVGKTSIIQCLLGNPVTLGSTFPSLNVSSFQYDVIIDYCHVYANIFDTPGDVKLRELTDIQYHNQNALIFVYAVDEKSSLDAVKDFINVANEKADSNTSYFIIGNKADLDQSPTADYVNQYKDSVVNIFQVSALNGIGVTDAFNDIIRHIINDGNDKPQPNPIPPKKDKKGCC